MFIICEPNNVLLNKLESILVNKILIPVPAVKPAYDEIIPM